VNLATRAHRGTRVADADTVLRSPGWSSRPPAGSALARHPDLVPAVLRHPDLAATELLRLHGPFTRYDPTRGDEPARWRESATFHALTSLPVSLKEKP